MWVCIWITPSKSPRINYPLKYRFFPPSQQTTCSFLQITNVKGKQHTLIPM